MAGTKAAIDHIAWIGREISGDEGLPRREALELAFEGIEKHEDGLCLRMIEGLLEVDDLMITVRTVEDRVLINAPFPCKIVELNGEVEDNPDLVNEEAYGDGWCMIVKPHDWDEDMHLDEGEYIEYLNEI